MRRLSAFLLIAGGVVSALLGAVLLFSGVFLAMGPEDEVPLLGWLLPLGIGIASVAGGRRLSGSRVFTPEKGSTAAP